MSTNTIFMASMPNKCQGPDPACDILNIEISEGGHKRNLFRLQY